MRRTYSSGTVKALDAKACHEEDLLGILPWGIAGWARTCCPAAAKVVSFFVNYHIKARYQGNTSRQYVRVTFRVTTHFTEQL
jgi:hypothetical protein